jgi:hypothetical protein
MEEKVTFFDPTEGAYREIPLSLAKKFVESAKNVEKQIEAKEEEE